MHNYNYVYFNCDNLNNQNSSTCEVWRIIGVFDVDDGYGNYEQRIKLVRGSALPDTKQWDTRNSEMSTTGNYGKNEWVGSTMQTYLNDEGEYYTRTGTAANYGLKTIAKNMISEAKYYLGGIQYDNSNPYYGTVDAIYLFERGTKTFSYENYCLTHSSDIKCTTDNYCENNPSDELCTATRSKFWVGEVALMYPSDEYLVYSNGVDALCYANPKGCSINPNSSNGGLPSNGWVYNSNNLEGQNGIYWNWFISPNVDHSFRLFYNEIEGNLYHVGNGFTPYAVRPVLYLSSNVKITDGTGEQNNPYKLGL